MFVVTKYFDHFSPAMMRFHQWWIYDLTAFHDFWRQEVRARRDIIHARTPWLALLKAYRLQAFSPLEAIAPFVSDYHSFFETKVSSKKIKDVFSILRRLGLHRLGNFKRLPIGDLHKRFGKIWADLFYGLQAPEQAPWIWKPYRPLSEIVWAHDFDFAASDLTPLMQALEIYLKKLAEDSPHLNIQKFSITLVLFDWPEDTSFEILNAHPYLLSRDLVWILRVFDERFRQLKLSSYVSRLILKISQAAPLPQIQLGLFEDRAKAMARDALCKKLLNEGFHIFEPEILPSYTPEGVWRPQVPDLRKKYSEKNKRENHLLDLSQGMIRPLIQESPSRVSEPTGPLWFTEKLSWFDDQGSHRERDYFITRDDSAWIWVFQNEKQEWFRQGIIE